MDFTSELSVTRHGQQDPSIVHSYEQHKSNILNVLRKLILKDTVTNGEWQNLFYDVHMVCLWDIRGPEKLLKLFRKELNDSYMCQVKRRLKYIEDGQQLLKEYVAYWIDFKKHCDRLALAFQQLDLATRDALHRGLFHSKSNNPTVIKLHTQNICSKYNINTKKDGATSTSITSSSPSQSQSQSPPPLPLTQPSAASKPSLAKNAFPYSTVRCLMLKMWADEIINPLIERLINNVQELLISERSELIIDSTLIVSLRESFGYLDELRIIDYNQNYMKIFEQIYVDAIGLFYSSIPDNYLRKNGVICYIEWALGKFEREEQKAAQYLESNSDAIEKVSEACKKTLIGNFVEQLFFASMHYIKANHIDNIQLLYRFFDKIDGVVERLLDEQFRSHIVTTGNICLSNTDLSHNGNPEFFVDKLLEVYNKFDKIVNVAFSNDPRARQVFEEAIGLIINDPGIFKPQTSSNEQQQQQNFENNGPIKFGINGITKSEPESRCSEVLANYCNYLFRKSAFSRKLTNEDLNNRLDELYLVIKLLKNKEAFIKIHKYHLMRRLILDVTINLEKEEKFINCLRDIPGMPLDEINELLRMFKDLKSSDVLNTQFMKSMKPAMSNLEQSVNNNNTISNITSQMTDRLNIQENNNQLAPINVKVLNPSAWAKNLDRCPVSLPDEITSLMPSFEAFYKNQYEGRELEWCHQLSNGVVSFKNHHGHKYDLEVTAAQLSVLSSFNNQPFGLKTLDDLKSTSNLSANELRRTLWSLLSNPKLKSQIMCCVPKLESLKDLDRTSNSYCVNHEFVLIKNSKPQSKGRVCLIGRLQI